MTPTSASPTHLSGAARTLGTDARMAVGLARQPWSLGCAGVPLRVRGADAADLARVALFHGRCSGDTLLQRYLMGRRPPSLATVTAMLAEPLVLLAQAPGPSRRRHCRCAACGTAWVRPTARAPISASACTPAWTSARCPARARCVRSWPDEVRPG